MKDNRKTFLEKLCMYFHEDEEVLKQHFDVREVKRILRLRALYKEVLRYPMDPDYKRSRWLIERYGIKERQANYDIADLRAVVGPSLTFDKNFERYELAQGIRDMMAVAREKGDVKAWASLSEKYDSIMRLSKDDPEPVNKDRVPLAVEPTDDIRVLGLPPLQEDERSLKDRIRRRFDKEMVEDASFVEVLNHSNDPFYSIKLRKERKQAAAQKDFPKDDTED